MNYDETIYVKYLKLFIVADKDFNLSDRNINEFQYDHPLYLFGTNYYRWGLCFMKEIQDNILTFSNTWYLCRERMQASYYKRKKCDSKIYFLVKGNNFYFNKLVKVINYIENKLMIKNKTKIMKLFSNAILFDMSDFWVKYGLRFSLFTAIIKAIYEKKNDYSEAELLIADLYDHPYFTGAIGNASFKLFLDGYTVPISNRNQQWVASNHALYNVEQIKTKLLKQDV